jgi:patatin-like phospholipase/acyl hydrolase
VMVMATLAVNGDQTLRCTLMKGFYDRANPHQDTTYPDIDPKVMSTLSDLSGQAWTVDSLWEHIQSVLNSRE